MKFLPFYRLLLIALCFLNESSSDFFHRSHYLPIPPPHQPNPYYLQRAHNPYHSYRAFQTAIKLLHLDEGDPCRRGHGLYPDYVCAGANECRGPMEQSVKTQNFLDICTFDGTRMIVCCPSQSIVETEKATRTPNDVPRPRPAEKTRTEVRRPPSIGETEADSAAEADSVAEADSAVEADSAAEVPRQNVADEKCVRYRRLRFPKEKFFFIAVVGGKEALSQEFPHMALLGYGDTTEFEEDWKCGGSLINERWVLSAAHCQRTKDGILARWVRLGELELGTSTDMADPQDFRIVDYVMHPDYKSSERYNDIGLFRLQTEVKFSSFIKPICLNSDQSLEPKLQIATGWGRTSTAGTSSNRLLKVGLNVFMASKCNNSYIPNNPQELRFGILSDRMICAGSYNDEEDTCSGDSGGPLQVMNEDGSYTQFGITSFGPAFCGIKETPAVYTRVSKYVPWIEKIVWPNN